MAKNKPSKDIEAQDITPESPDMGDVNPVAGNNDSLQQDLGSLDQEPQGSVDLGKLPALAKFKKFGKKGK